MSLLEERNVNADTHTQRTMPGKDSRHRGGWPCEDGDRDWNYAATSQGMSRLPEDGKARKDPPLKDSDGAQNCLDFRLLASKTVRE